MKNKHVFLWMIYFLVMGGIWGFYWWYILGEQHSIVPVVEVKFSYYDIDGYFPTTFWDEACWMKALKKVQNLKEDKDVVMCRVAFGTVGSSLGHAWVEYLRLEHGVEVLYSYDPTFDKYINLGELNYGYVYNNMMGGER